MKDLVEIISALNISNISIAKSKRQVVTGICGNELGGIVQGK